MIGIYRIQNIVNGKCYIGQSVDVNNRIKGHQRDLRESKHSNSYLQRAWDKYGEENFIFEPIEECEESILTEKEQYWMDFYGGFESDSTYNLREAGNKGRLSEETKRKLSLANLGKTYSAERNQKIREARLGKPLSKLHRKHISETRQRTPEGTYSGEVNGMYGRKRTEEEKQKIRESLRITLASKEPYRHSEEIKKRISEANKGKTLSEEAKRKIGEANTGNSHPGLKGEASPWWGKNHTEESKEKMREKAKGNTATKGYKWINNGVISKRVPASEFEDYLKNNWKSGRTTLQKPSDNV